MGNNRRFDLSKINFLKFKCYDRNGCRSISNQNMKHTRYDWAQMQSLPLEAKILMTKRRIRDWYDYFNGNVYLSVSGKDSTVLRDMALQVRPDIECVYVDTGLEYPEVRKFIKSLSPQVTILRPEMGFVDVIKKYGYPVLSKEISECVYNARQFLNGGGINSITENLTELASMPVRVAKVMGKLTKNNQIMENIPNKDRSMFSLEKYKDLINVDFKISNQCCNVMKKKPLHEFSKQTGKMPITGQLAEESRLRYQQWLKNGCNGFDMKSPISNPMSFWTEQDVLSYIKKYNIPIASVYGSVVFEEDNVLLCDSLTGNGKLTTTGCKRTGCIYCGYGAQNKNDDRFVRLKQTHPKQYEYCLGGGEYNKDGLWQPNINGLGLKHVFDVLNNLYGKNFIKY